MCLCSVSCWHKFFFVSVCKYIIWFVCVYRSVGIGCQWRRCDAGGMCWWSSGVWGWGKDTEFQLGKSSEYDLHTQQLPSQDFWLRGKPVYHTPNMLPQEWKSFLLLYYYQYYYYISFFIYKEYMLFLYILFGKIKLSWLITWVDKELLRNNFY